MPPFFHMVPSAPMSVTPFSAAIQTDGLCCRDEADADGSVRRQLTPSEGVDVRMDSGDLGDFCIRRPTVQRMRAEF
jgi:hypothetical protein